MNKIVKGSGSSPGSAPSSVPRSRGVVPAEEVDARAVAERVVGEATEKADAIVEAARAQAEALYAEAVEAGRRAGQAKAVALFTRARAAEAESLARAERDVAALARQMAQKILGRELALRPEAVVDIAAEVLRDARRARQIVLRIHPEDQAALDAGSAVLAAAVGKSGILQLRPDNAVARGGCIVESDLGTIDGRLDEQLDALERALSDGADPERRP